MHLESKAWKFSIFKLYLKDGGELARIDNITFA